MKYTVLVCLLHIFSITYVWAQSSSIKIAQAKRTAQPPKIDGNLSDSVWNSAPVINQFIQNDPDFNTPSTFPTEVRILFDDYAIYVGAMLYDTHPDSILMQLGERDDENVNADKFGIAFDTYHNHLDAYTFLVTACGVQIDYRQSDNTFDAVWESKTQTTKNGWIAELKIPYSALRFPMVPNQEWGLQVYRGVRRYRELDQWALEQKGSNNTLIYWGTISGIENIQVPLRLSVTPYFSLYGEHYPYNIKGKNNYSTSFNGGIDLKLGLDESFTLDITLLPDFSQVQSDNEIKNLTAFETEYPEQRPFFKEAVDLFQKGGLFYSRRIGERPSGFYEVENQLKKGEYITENPSKAELVNATKISGRNKNGLAIGIFNAMTENTYAKVTDSLTGKTRKVLTEPFANYNIVVFDQAMKNHSSFYLVNTNVIRYKGGDDANVTAGGLTLNDKKSIYQLQLYSALSQNFTETDTSNNVFIDKLGAKYSAGISKTRGNFKFNVSETVIDQYFEINDMGLLFRNNEKLFYADASYSIYKPFWIVKDITNSLSYDYITNYLSGKIRLSRLQYQLDGTFTNYLSFWSGTNTMLNECYDYQEPRTNGRYYISPKYNSAWIGFSSDYRKPFALDWSFTITEAPRDNFISYYSEITPIFRINDHLSFDHTFSSDFQYNDIGFVNNDSLIIFGRRDITTINNTLTGKYMFNNKASLSLRVRHYWSKGEYNKYFALKDDGTLVLNSIYNDENDFNFNAFNIDLVYGWWFAPGSIINIVWKNAIINEETAIENKYFTNLKNTWEQPQANSLAFKILYYFDYQNIKKSKKRNTTT